MFNQKILGQFVTSFVQIQKTWGQCEKNQNYEDRKCKIPKTHHWRDRLFFSPELDGDDEHGHGGAEHGHGVDGLEERIQ